MKKAAIRGNVVLFVAALMLGIAASPAEATTITAPGTYVVQRYTISYVNATELKVLDAFGATAVRDGAGGDLMFGSGQFAVTWVKFAIPEIAPGLELDAATINVGGEISSYNGPYIPYIIVGWVADYIHSNLTWATRDTAADLRLLRAGGDSGPSLDYTRYSVSIMDWLRKPGEGPGTDLCVLQTWGGGGARGWMEDLSMLGTAGHTNVTTITLTVRANPISHPGTYVIPRYTISYVNASETKALDVYSLYGLRDGAGSLDSVLGSGAAFVTWIKFAIPAMARGMEIKAATINVGGQISSANASFTPSVIVGWVADYTHTNLTWATRDTATDLKTLRAASDSGPSIDYTRYSASIMDWLSKPGEGPGTDLCVLQTWAGGGARSWMEDLSLLGMNGNTNVTSITLSVECPKGTVILVR